MQNLDFPYVTLRNRTDSPEPEGFYGSARSDLKTGFCRVGARNLGVLSSLTEAVPHFLKEELLRVEHVREMEKTEVLGALEKSAGAQGPALYVHGYNISFEKGCRRAALFQKNAGLENRFLWFSWPSNGAVAYYTHDEADLYWSVPDLANTIVELAQRFGSGAIDVIGHSLGARGVMLALAEMASRYPGLQLRNVVLLAPDIDFEIFERILPRIAPVADNITVYATSGDKPLALSRQLHGYSRLGESGNDVSRISGVEVIDLSHLPDDSPTGHLYHIYSSDVGTDLAALINEGKRAAERTGLLAGGGNLWYLKSEAAGGQDRTG